MQKVHIHNTVTCCVNIIHGQPLILMIAWTIHRNYDIFWLFKLLKKKKDNVQIRVIKTILTKLY